MMKEESGSTHANSTAQVFADERLIRHFDYAKTVISISLKVPMHIKSYLFSLGSKRITQASLPVILAATLSACGDGNGNGGNLTTAQAKAASPQAQAQSPAPQAAAVPPGLYFSEVAANYRGTAGVSWVEVFNNSPAAIHLNDYRLRANGLDNASKALSANPVTFDLPKIDIPAGGYFVLAGKSSTYLKDTGKSAYILASVAPQPPATGSNRTYLPYWTDKAGFVELVTVADSKTVDFVRFGSEAAKPTTAAAWNGDNAAAFPVLPNFVSARTLDPLDNFDRSIVRLSSDFRASAGKSDWTLVQFPTPGGPNDVPAGTVDSDNDGIPDTAKVAGGKFAGLDLYSLGARKGQKDLFIQVDYMTSTDPALSPRKEALQKVVAAFRAHNTQVHFDAGNLFNAALAPADFNLSGDVSRAQVFDKCTNTPDDPQDANCGSLYQYSSGSLDVRRKPVFRYMLMASSQKSDGSSGSSGIAELPGNKFLVTLGKWGFSGLDLTVQKYKNLLINYQAGTIMHEFGHTIGLHHGGFEDANYKPNYFSIMNYLYQLDGLPTNPKGMGPTQRWYHTINTTNHVAVPGYAADAMPSSALDDGPMTNSFRIDYSNGSGANLNEASLLESDNIGRGHDAGAYGDWNYDGVQQAKRYRMDLNGSGAGILSDNDDWSKLQLVLNSHSDPLPGSAQSKASSRTASLPVLGTLVKEDAPPASLLRDLANMRSAR
ncbi:conserved repeat domain protein [Collimonas fungivorans Ter331]|uniref:Conserved repeat domain protein n=2 Tax=Collimonas fungivorans TaxID=158899 RepID=G0ABF4_COLFT|nr:conserved repeat domain protein [Collimonas fungivorans Ter331]